MVPMRAWAIFFAGLGAACGAQVDATTDAPARRGDAGDSVDGAVGPDAALGPWVLAGAIPTAATAGMAEDDGSPAPGETELVFSGKLPGVNKDLYVLARGAAADPWGPATKITELDTTATEQTPRITADGLAIYFSTARGGGPGGDDIWSATRTAPGAPWTGLAVVPGVNSTDDDRTLTPCAGDRYLMISFRAGTGDVYEGVLGGAAPAPVAALSDPAANETGTFVSADCLRAWFASNRDGTNDVFAAHRDSVASPWILDGKVTEISTDTYDESDPWVSADGHRMVFASTQDGDENDLYTATR